MNERDESIINRWSKLADSHKPAWFWEACEECPDSAKCVWGTWVDDNQPVGSELTAGEWADFLIYHNNTPPGLFPRSFTQSKETK